MIAALASNPEVHVLIAYAIFFASYLVFAMGRFPGTKIDRPAAAVIGAALMFVFRVISPHDGILSIDYATIVLLASMMLIVASLHLAGFFEWVAGLVFRFVSPSHLLPGVIFTSGILSAILVNDVVCLVMTPLLLKVCRQFSKQPTPYLLALATASNVGSVATITGNPQNILIGSLSGISYRHFSATLGPVAVIGLFIDWLVLQSLYPNRDGGSNPARTATSSFTSGQVNRRQLAFPLLVLALVLAGFLAGVPPALVAAMGGALLLIRRSVHPEEIYKEIDWPLLVFFTGLFLIIGAAEQAGIAQQMLTLAERMNLHNPWMFAGAVALLSNVVSNVPAVMLLKGLVPQFHNPTQFWLLLAMASTLAGNLTVTGSIANIIVVEKARPEVEITFVDYLRAGVPVTLATLAIGAGWLTLVR